MLKLIIGIVGPTSGDEADSTLVLINAEICIAPGVEGAADRL